MKDVISRRAITIQQPFVEEILFGLKKYEYRSRPTKILDKVYLYASPRPRELSRCKKRGYKLGDIPSGFILGSIEISECKYFNKYKCYGYKSTNPKKYKKLIKPKNQPQPYWFFHW